MHLIIRSASKKTWAISCLSFLALSFYLTLFYTPISSYYFESVCTYIIYFTVSYILFTFSKVY